MFFVNEGDVEELKNTVGELMLNPGEYKTDFYECVKDLNWDSVVGSFSKILFSMVRNAERSKY
ncbi:hypothetical protein HLB03_04910 [Acidianus sp. DSM 29099]|nr:hypothetical protein [Acidianus sp. RZ1]